jgi:ABC-type glycerol-3-phosphate transport system permease component
MSLKSSYDTQWGPLMAAYSIASIPLILIFVFTMKLFVKGLSSGAVKG